MKKLLKRLTPPILWDLLKRIKPNYGFFGVYSEFSEVSYEDPWLDVGWISGQKQKLSNLESSRNEQLFLPLPHLNDYLMIPCLLINLLSQKNSIKVLDHYGGTGFIYHVIYPYLLFPENVKWSVLDNPTLLKIGVDYTKQMVAQIEGDSLGISYISDMPDPSLEKFDVIYVNSSVQYYSDYKKNIRDLIALQPKYFIFTRLMSGEGITFVCYQKIIAKGTPCRFINSWEFSEIFRENGYDLIFKAPNKEENYGRGSIHDREFKDIPEENQTPFSIHMVFGKREERKEAL